MKRVLLAVLGWCLGWAGAGGGGQPPPSASSRTVPVLIFNFTPDAQDRGGPFLCADGQAVFVETVPDALRLTRRGEVFVLPRITQSNQYGENGVSWVETGPNAAELTLGRTQPVRCFSPQSEAVYAQALNLGETQTYRCAGGAEVRVSPVQIQGFKGDTLNMVVVLSQSQNGQAPVTTTLLPQVRSVSGVKYKSSQWTWFTNGREGDLKRQGQPVAQGCRR